MNGKIYLGLVTLPMLLLSMGNSFFFYTQLLNNEINSLTAQPKHWQTQVVASRNEDRWQCLRSGRCTN
ncbi:MAG: hypothetical protein QNJ36_13485 [Calothrix sp. MO_167.B42]|nr:hypothetical protein [Calothrix sp. MO_167.B42]